MASKINFGFYLFLYLIVFFGNKYQGRSLEVNLTRKSGAENDNPDINHFSGILVRDLHDVHFLGAKAELSVYAHEEVKMGQISVAYVAVRNGIHTYNYDVIKVGWMINPSLYKDSYTHFFTAWMANTKSSSSGCFDNLCGGLILSEGALIKPGDIIKQAAHHVGRHNISIEIKKDFDTGDWWINYGEYGPKLKPIGFLPNTLFSSLSDQATHIDFSGYVGFPNGDFSPPMGSGYLPADASNAATISDICVINKDGQCQHLDQTGYTKYNDKCGCFGLEVISTTELLYGGPGHCAT